MTDTTRTELPLVQSSGSGGCGDGCGCGHGAGAATTTATASATTAEFLVEGMTCSHCVASVTEELSEISGVEQVAVDLHPDGASRVIVSSAQPLAAQDVRAAVEDAGYRLATVS
ncbi:heavy-metal-associated domain-containing protein [Agromyces sp. SYSU T00194]|uniref:heavy-metal-associated domain-containing protein n=1 Tax=Agromyces chitinivorans TaxID=3158560 RepID=UPI00339B01AC